MPENPLIHAIGIAVPPFRIAQDQHCSILRSANGMSREEALLLQKIYNHSGIESRHSVLEEFEKGEAPGNAVFYPASGYEAPVSKRMELYSEHAPRLCAEAAANCLAQLPEGTAQRVTHVVTFSCTGMHAPGIDMQLVEQLGLSRSVERVCINFMGCYAGINALKTAWHIGRSQPEAVVLVAGVELCTLHYRKSKTQDHVVANAIFGDGAAACIVSAQELHGEKAPPRLRLLDFYAEFEPGGKEEMVWSIGDTGFDLKLSAYVPALIKEHIHSLTERLFSRTGIRQEDIDFFAIHPGGTRILQACEQALGIEKTQNGIAYDVLRRFGNMSAVTILFVLRNFLLTFVPEDKGKKMLACAFGPGLTMESMLADVC